jgi:uncharacterized protein
VLCLSLGVLICQADPIRPVLDAVPDAFTPAVQDQERLGGLIGDSLRANTEGYLERVDTARLLQPFVQRSKGEDPARMGESVGWFLQAAATSYEYNGDVQLKSILDHVASRLLATQNSDGYLGTHSDARSWKPDELPSLANTLGGLVAYARITGDDTALAASRRMGDLVLRTLFADSVKHNLLGVVDWRSAPSGVGLLRPLAELYRSTNDRRYLDFAKTLADKLSGVATNPEIQVTYASGLISLYRLTGNADELKQAVSAWKGVTDHHLSITGAPLVTAESATPAADKIASGCTVAEWMRLNLDLLRATGGAEYAAQIERTVYNQLLASQDHRTGQIDSYVQLNGSKHFAVDPGPCHAAASYALALMPDFFWGRYGEGIALMSYSAGRASTSLRRRATVQLYEESDYPLSGEILLHVEPSHDQKFPLRLRVPRWATNYQVEAGRTRMAGKPGEFLILEREWKKGSTVKISFELPVSVTRNARQANEVALERGPQVLALAKGINPNIEDLSAAQVGSHTVSLKNADDSDATPGSSNQVYSFMGHVGSQQQQLFTMPFSEASEYEVWLRGEAP